MKSSLLFLFALFATSSSLFADDWPRWMGAGMDSVWSEDGIIENFGEGGPEIDWRIPIGGGYAGPSVVGDRLYIMDRTDDDKGVEVENNIRNAGEIPGGERVQCLDIKDGSVIWTHTYNCPYSVAYPTGPRCTPAVDGEHVYTLGAMGDLICFNAMGEIVWQKKLTEVYETKPPLWGYASHPLVDGDQLLVPVGGEGSGVVSFNKLTGEENWRAVTTRDVCYSPLVIYEPEGAGRQLIFWHAEGIVSLDPQSGEEFWTVKFPEERSPSDTAIATPRIIGDKLLISEFYKGSLLLQLKSDPPSVEEIWRTHKTDPRNQSSLNSMMTTPVIKDGHAYGIAYAGPGKGVFRCINIESGEMLWTKKDWMEEEAIVFATSFIVENSGRYFLFNDNGELMIAKLSPEGFEEVDRAKILEATSAARGRNVVWSHPAFANRKMFARNDKEIVCVDLARPEE